MENILHEKRGIKLVTNVHFISMMCSSDYCGFLKSIQLVNSMAQKLVINYTIYIHPAADNEQ